MHPAPHLLRPQIGSKFELTSSDVADANPQVDNIELIQPGQVLYLPCGGERPTHPTAILPCLPLGEDTTRPA